MTLQHPRKKRTYTVASKPRSSLNLSSGNQIVCLTQDKGHPEDEGGEGNLTVNQVFGKIYK